jgi:hypothetical protein
LLSGKKEGFSLAASANFSPERVLDGEVYGHSQHASHEVGIAVVAQLVEVQGVAENDVWAQRVDDELLLRALSAETVAPKVELLFANFLTGTDENVVTHKELGESLVLGRPKIRKRVNGKVVDPTGRPMIDIVTNGAAYSAELAKKDPEFAPQAFRDKGDVAFQEVVDTLQIGEVAHAMSMDPKELLSKNPKKWTEVGYYEGMAVQHVAYRIDEDTVLLWTNIIKQSDKRALARIYNEDYGQNIPEDLHSDLWIRHVHRSFVTREQVDAIGRNTLDKHKELIDSQIKHYSVGDFIDENMSVVQEYFHNYALPVSIAHATGRNTPVIQELARSIYHHVEGMKPEVMRQLLRISNTSSFDDDSALIMQSMVRYALVEELSKKLPEFMQRMDVRDEKAHAAQEVSPHVLAASYVHNLYNIAEIEAVQRRTTQEMNMVMAMNIQVGVRAGRSLGGCSPISLTADRDGEAGVLNNPFNDIYTRKTQEQVVSAEDEFGSLDFECSKGHKNTRPRGKLIPYCKTCGENVSCAPEEKVTAPRPTEAKSNVLSLFKVEVENERAKAA